MKIDAILGTDHEYTGINNTYNKREEEEKNTPLSWQPDKVSISDEAWSAYAAFMESQKSDPKEGADQEFAQYLKEAKGQAPSADEDKDEIDELYEQLDKLNTQLFQVMNSEMPEEAKQGKLAAITAQITAVQAQIDAVEK